MLPGMDRSGHDTGPIRRLARFLIREWVWWVVPLVLALGLLLLLALLTAPVELLPFVYVPS